MFTGLLPATTGLLMSAAQDDGPIVLRHDLGTRYNRTEYEAACGSNVVRFRFRNGPNHEHGRVDQVLIGSRPVRGAADQLRIRAAGRVIGRIEIMNCGMDDKRPVIRGVMEMSEIESRRAGMQPRVFFRLSRQGRRGWTMSID